MRIRPAIPDDCLGIAKVHVACWRETYAGLLPSSFIERRTVEVCEAQWRRALDRVPRLTDVFIAEAGDVLAGFAACGPRRGDLLTQDTEVYAIYLLRAHQRHGAGRALFRAMALRLRECGFRSAAAWVLRENAPARRFYEAIGGTVIADRTMSEADATAVEVAYGWDDLGALARYASDLDL